MPTELEKLRRAAQYIAQLAEGLDPISGQELPQGSTLNQVRLSRCFFYVADVLRQVIDNGGQVGRPVSSSNPYAPPLPPFTITSEQRAQIPIAPDTMIKRFAENINALVDLTTMRRLKIIAFNDWLVREGYMREDMYNGKRRKIPTEQGRAAGITDEQRQTQQQGYYTAILYDERAQRLLVDNLDEIIAISNGTAQNNQNSAQGQEIPTA